MSLEQPLFTVATITYNSGRWVHQAIESILASSYNDFELLISDDCSTDNTWEIIQGYKDPRIKAWRNETNIGEYPNRNKVLHAAKGKYILFVDGDDVLYKHSLEMLHRYTSFFPNAKGFWGVYPVFIDFAILPFEFSNEELTKLNYLSNFPISITGFAESVFHIQTLKEFGGFAEQYAIGDYFVKKNFSLYHSIVLFPAGISFWRQSIGQSSNVIRNNFRQFIETMQIDYDLLFSNNKNVPLNMFELKIAQRNFKISRIKLLVSNTLFKLKLIDFFILWFKLKVPFSHFIFLFKKGKYPLNNLNKEMPFQNNFNFL